MRSVAATSTPSVTARWGRTAAMHSGSRSGRQRCTDESTDTQMAVRVAICPSVRSVPSCAPCPHAQTISRSGRLPSCSHGTALLPLTCTRTPCATVPRRVPVAMHQPDPNGPLTIAHASQGHHTAITGRIAAAHSRMGARWLQVGAVAASQPALSSSWARDHVLVLASHSYSISYCPPPHPAVVAVTKKQHAEQYSSGTLAAGVVA